MPIYEAEAVCPILFVERQSFFFLFFYFPPPFFFAHPKLAVVPCEK